MIRNRSKSPSSRRKHNDPDEEPRGRKNIITPKQIREMEKVLEEDGIEARALTWEQLGYEIGLDCSVDTIRRAMGSMEYHKCIACRRSWVNKKTAATRVTWTTDMLAAHPNPEDWERVRFSDEVHFEYGSQGKIRIIRKPEQRYCQNCIQKADEFEKIKIKNVTTVGRPWVIISNQTFIFIEFQPTPMEN